MTVVYYKKDGKITMYHKVRAEWSREELEAKVRSYNNEHGNGEHPQTAHIYDPPEGSFEEYLLGYAERKAQYTAESIREAKDAIDKARDMIEALEPVKD